MDDILDLLDDEDRVNYRSEKSVELPRNEKLEVQNVNQSIVFEDSEEENDSKENNFELLKSQLNGSNSSQKEISKKPRWVSYHDSETNSDESENEYDNQSQTKSSSQ